MKARDRVVGGGRQHTEKLASTQDTQGPPQGQARSPGQGPPLRRTHRVWHHSGSTALTASYPESTPSTRLSMKKEPMMMRGMKYNQFQVLPAASLVWKQEEMRKDGDETHSPCHEVPPAPVRCLAGPTVRPACPSPQSSLWTWGSPRTRDPQHPGHRPACQKAKEQPRRAEAAWETARATCWPLQDSPLLPRLLLVKTTGPEAQA